ncbi:MAG: glycine zipper 2TM domain-containing protein [Betaproteobacteria bacterium]|nr:MAG: glycine zipper 2TM domain-containing protein [Betaproteobacteria bacterium]TMH91453.1 MAG: glycine zipper 2TM domain-containing protein [Betaproteobacteria bacterium]
MEAQAARRTHPLVIIAAVAITLFSLVGIGAVLGWIPTSVGTPGAASTPLAQAPEQPAAQPEPAKPVERQPVVRPKPVVRSEPPHVAARAAVPPPPPVVVAAICRECAVIEEVREVEKAGQASGAGAVGGAVVGGVVGHQMGGGRGKDFATILGALGGGLAGNAIEKNAKKTVEYQIVIRYEDGTKGLFTQVTPPSWRSGDKVKVINGVIQGRS